MALDVTPPVEAPEITFLPSHLRPDHPDYYVWWTGTLGQAEWLITHASTLAGKALPREVPHDLEALPEQLRPLLALEQPDLIVSTAAGKPLLSIEITEQREFGSNSEQRMGRFWSAVACGVASAYLLPIEGYQVEKASATEARILTDPNSPRRELRLFLQQLPYISFTDAENQGFVTRHALLEAVRAGTLTLHRDPTTNALRLNALRRYISRHVTQDPSDPVKHIDAVPFQEFLHDVNGTIYKAYIRRPVESTSKVLAWFTKCSSQVAAYPFKFPSSLSALFETGGLLHTLDDAHHPHLAFRNLPPGPGVGEVVHRRAKKDEISLFFDFTAAVTSGTPQPDLARELFDAPGEYFDAEIAAEWVKPLDSVQHITTVGSGDYSPNAAVTQQLLRWANVAPAEQPHVLPGGRAHIFKIYCTAPSRELSDPYSGKLAVRDVLFCRDPEQLRHLARFERNRGLIFLVEMRDGAASQNPFIYNQINRTYAKHFPKGDALTPQAKVIKLLENLRAEAITKALRCHIAFSDLIIVRRDLEPAPQIEAIQGLPALLRSGQVSSDATFVRSLSLDH